MLKDPDYWKDPDQFRPERFSDDKEGKENIGAFIPFSFGPRDCVAKKFAGNFKNLSFDILKLINISYYFNKSPCFNFRDRQPVKNFKD